MNLPIPKISIITVVYNGVDTIEQTILSVINQTYKNIEYVIIDGDSTDGTVEIIKSYELKIKKEFPNVYFYWISEPDKGIYDAMNKGIDRATGNWINFMNSGDYFYNNSVLQIIFDKQHDCDILYGDALSFSSVGEYVQKPMPLNLILKYMVFCHQVVFVKGPLMKDMQFDINYKISADYNFFYNCYKLNKKFLYIPVIVAAYNSEIGMSKNYELLVREYAMIHGVEHKLTWKIQFIFGMVMFRFKNLMKQILPHRIVYRIRKNNLYRNEKLNKKI